MKSLIPLLQIELNFSDYKFGLLCFISAFAISMVCIPPIIRLVNKYRLHDIPDSRKEHSLPTPTLGGIAIIVGMTMSIALWFPFPFQVK
jgi:UDP-N-acetylmuramyl pentapeptide phosphotransferase/UDP-N-acetylglucosamine-1-phosphate transferase